MLISRTRCTRRLAGSDVPRGICAPENTDAKMTSASASVFMVPSPPAESPTLLLADFVDLNLCRLAVLSGRHGNVQAILLRHESRVPRARPRRNLRDRLVGVRRFLLVDVHEAVAGAQVDALVSGVVGEIVNAAGRRQARDRLSGVAVEDDQPPRRPRGDE